MARGLRALGASEVMVLNEGSLKGVGVGGGGLGAVCGCLPT